MIIILFRCGNHNKNNNNNINMLNNSSCGSSNGFTGSIKVNENENVRSGLYQIYSNFP